MPVDLSVNWAEGGRFPHDCFFVYVILASGLSERCEAVFIPWLKFEGVLLMGMSEWNV